MFIEINNIIPNNSSSEGIAPRPYDTQLIDIKYNIQNYNFNNFNETIVKCFEKFKHSKITSENKNDFFICLDIYSFFSLLAFLPSFLFSYLFIIHSVLFQFLFLLYYLFLFVYFLLFIIIIIIIF